MAELPAIPPERQAEPTEREKSLWDYQRVPDSQLNVILDAVANGDSIKKIVKENNLITASYKEVIRALHEDPEVLPIYIRARGVQLSGFIDNIIEEIEAAAPDFQGDKLEMNLWLQNRRLKIDGYSKLIKTARATIIKDSDNDEDANNGIVINITQFSSEKMKEAKTVAIVAAVDGVKDVDAE